MTVTIDRALDITGYMSRDELLWLATRAAVSSLIIEVGSYKGRSTRALADNTLGTVLAVDPWDGYRNDDGSQARWIDTKGARSDFEANLADHLATRRVRMLALPFREAFPVGAARHIKADMIFIDGDHRYSEVMGDIDLARAMLAPGGLLCGHDYGHPKWQGVKRAVDETFGPRVQLCRSIWWVDECGS